MISLGMERRGMVLPGQEMCGAEGSGVLWQVRRVKARLGKARLSGAGAARPGLIRFGLSRRVTVT